MPPLAFDKQGKPFGWSRATRQLRVRVFKNPSARGTCCQVLDGEGNPLYIDAETDYMTFRKLVGHSPGLYRLDQCDEDGVEVDDAQPAYVSLDLTRNASMSSGDGGDPNPLVIIEHMFAIHADVMKTMAAQQASLMSATAEILRAPIRPPLPTAEPMKKEREDDEVDEDEDEDEEELEPEDPWAAWRPYLKMVEPHLPKIGAFFYEQFSTYLKNTASPTPAAAPNVPAVPVPTVSSSPAAQGAVGGPMSAVAGAPVAVETPTTNQTTPHVPAAEVSAPATTATATPAVEASTPSEATTQVAAVTPTDSPSDGAPRNAMPMPTPAQMAHLYAIREELSPNERAIAERVMASMNPEMLVRWLAELTSLSVDDAVRAIRTTITELRTSKRTGA